MVLRSPEIPTGTHLLKTVCDTGVAKASLCVQLNNSDNNEAKNQNRIKKKKTNYRTQTSIYVSSVAIEDLPGRATGKEGQLWNLSYPKSRNSKLL